MAAVKEVVCNAWSYVYILCLVLAAGRSCQWLFMFHQVLPEKLATGVSSTFHFSFSDNEIQWHQSGVP